MNARREKRRGLWDFLKQDYVVKAIEKGVVRLSAESGHRIEIHFPDREIPFGVGYVHRFIVKTLQKRGGYRRGRH